MTLEELRQQEYEQRLIVNRLQRELYQQENPASSLEKMTTVVEEEGKLEELETQRIAAETAANPKSGIIVDTDKETHLFGPKTTGLEARVHLRMEHVPTSIYHLLNAESRPLISCFVKSHDNDKPRRVRVTSFIDGYSARAVDSMELASLDDHSFEQLPTLYADRINGLTEITRATVNVQVEDLDGKVEIHKTAPVWLLAPTTAYLSIKDPSTNNWLDMTRYLGAFVTPNDPEIMTFLRDAAEAHPDVSLVGYQGNKDKVTPQVKSLYGALQNKGVTYVNSVISFNPQEGSSQQRVRLPSESLRDNQANCIDGTVLFASLLEAISMNPAIVIIPRHAFVAWQTWPKSDSWNYLETTMIHDFSFEEAVKSGQDKAKLYESQGKLKRWSLSELRTKHGILPMA